ncbi:hypothetical protein [Thaumasiovibrio sp. DFM-14]|uniref:hypothetical protein n=1 Tax=Thaumasiovibrio sp. DFM-14 TaxID=3384792 RepID=UPI0039A1FE4C
MVSQVNDLRSTAAGINNRQPVIARRNQAAAAVPDTQKADPLRLSRTLTPEHTRQQSLIQRAQNKMAAGQVAERTLTDIGNGLAQLSKRLHHVLKGQGNTSTMAQQLDSLKATMEERFSQAEHRGQAVLDRQLKPVFQGEARTQFRLKGLDSRTATQRDETLIFNFAKGGASAVPVRLEAGASPEKQAAQFRQVFNPQGVGVGLDRQRQLVFSASEEDWQHLSQHMRVVGQGERFPAGQANKAKLESTAPRFEPTNWKTDSKAQLQKTQVEAKRMLAQVKQSLQEVREHNREVQHKMDELNDRNGQLAATQLDKVMQQLDAMLGESDRFAVAYHNLKAQAHVHRHTVVSLLADL